jgi:hypothetical protein
MLRESGMSCLDRYPANFFREGRCGELTMLRRNARMSLYARTQWGEESRLLDPVLIAADQIKAELIGTCRQRLNIGDQLPSLFL